MAENGLIAAGQHRRHPPPLDREAGVAHRVDTVVNPVQAACSDSVKDMVLVEPGASQLCDGHHAVLPRRDLRH